MHTKIICVLLALSLFTVSCSSKKDLHSEGPSIIDWNDLQLTPRPNNNLCSGILSEELDWAKIKKDFNSGLFGGIYPEDPSKADKIAGGTLWIHANEPQSLKWRLWYPEGNDRPASLRLFVLLDEHQLKNTLPESGSYNDIKLERGDDKSLKLSIPPLQPGVHDIIAIGVPYLEEYPNEYGIVKLVYWRITLMVEPLPSPFRKLDFASLPAEGSITRNDPVMAFELTLKKDGADVWNWPDPWLHIDTNTQINFFVLAGHQDVENLDAPSMEKLQTSFFSVLFLMDYQQIEVAPNQVAFYGKVDKNTAYA